MPHKAVKTMGGSCLCGLSGALLCVILGGCIGNVVAPEPFYRSGLQPSWLWDDQVLVYVVVFAGIGGVIGGIGGSVVGAGLAAKASSSGTAELPSAAGPIPAGVPEPPTESPDAELARLKERVAELEAQQRKDGRFKEG
jgi:hypothetical protein